MVRAINKQGREAFFTERVWNLMPKHKNGWVEFEQQGEVLVPQQIIEFQQKKKEAVVVDTVKSEPVEELKEELFYDSGVPIVVAPSELTTNTVSIPAPAKVHTKKKPLAKKPVKRTKK